MQSADCATKALQSKLKKNLCNDFKTLTVALCFIYHWHCSLFWGLIAACALSRVSVSYLVADQTNMGFELPFKDRARYTGR